MDRNINTQNPDNENANNNNQEAGYPTPTPSSTSSSHSYRRTPSQTNLNANADATGSGKSDQASQDQQQQKKVKAPRLYHKKSRNGCQRCKARRVKVCFRIIYVFIPLISNLSGIFCYCFLVAPIVGYCWWRICAQRVSLCFTYFGRPGEESLFLVC